MEFRVLFFSTNTAERSVTFDCIGRMILARRKSFSLTAKELHISQQAVSKHIRSLEAELGFTLFFRDRTTMELTQAGNYMLEYVAQRDQILKEIHKTFTSKQLPDLRIHLQDLNAQEAIQAVSGGTIDLFVSSRYMAGHLPVSWKQIVLCKQPLYLLGSKNCSLEPGNLHFLPFYASEAGEENESALRMYTEKTCKKLGFFPQRITACPDMGTVILQILFHDGITIGTQPPKRQNLENFVLQKTSLFCEVVLSLPGSFHVGISEYIDVMGLISGGLIAFRAQFPHVSMEGSQCVNRILLEKIEDGSLDVAVINELQIAAGDAFAYQPIAKEDLRLYISEKQEGEDICGKLPHISASYGVWDTSDWEEVSHRMSHSLGYDFMIHYEAMNFRSCVLNLRTIPCSIVCDARFGYIPPEEMFISIPIQADSRLCALWHRKKENPMIREFVRFLTDYYA